MDSPTMPRFISSASPVHGHLSHRVFLHQQPEPIGPGQTPDDVPEIDPERPVPVPPDQPVPDPVEPPVVPEPAPPVDDPRPDLPDHIMTRAARSAAVSFI